MSTATATKPTLREIILDALSDAYWYRKSEVDDCLDCWKQPAGICADHEEDNAAASFYDDARKQIERTPSDPEVLALLGTEGAQS